MKQFILLIIGLLMCWLGDCQPKDVDTTRILSNSFVKLYLQTDRNAYLSGDTIWAKGFFINAENRTVTPKTMTFEILDPRAGKIVATRTFLPFKGAFPVSFSLPIDLLTGIYMIRAYTGDLAGEDNSLFTKLIKVYSIFKQKNEFPIYDKKLIFYPEGGRLMEGWANKIAFKFVDELGVPFDVSGKIVNASGEKICDFKSEHNGMGYFMLTPQSGTSYFAIVDSNASAQKYPLPIVENEGVRLNTSNDNQCLLFNINISSNSTINPAFIVLQGANKILYSSKLKTDSMAYNRSIDLADLPSGVARFGIYSKDTQLLAERLCFIDNKEYLLSADLSSALLNNNYRAENLLSLNLNESVKGTFAVSVIDAGFEKLGTDLQNIFSASFLTCYLKNKIYDAGSYLDGTYPNAPELLDLVMLTSQWGASKWENSGKQADSIENKRSLLSGTVFYKTTSKVYANKEVHLIAISEEDSTTKTTSFKTNNSGTFDLIGVDLLGRNRLLFSPADKKGGFIDVVLNPASIKSLDLKFPHVRSVSSSSGDQNNSLLDSFIRSKEYNENVTVSAKMRDRVKVLEKRYATGKFRDLYGETYDLTDLKPQKGHILDYLLIMHYPGIKIEIDAKNEYQVKARKINGEFVPSTIYLNEVLVLAKEQLFSVSPGNVAMIKLVQGVDWGEKGPSPAIAIYTRKGQDFNAASENYDIEYFEGYAKASDFYNPVYSNSVSGDATDRRITLLWNPKASTSNRVNFIPAHFYNTGFTKRFFITIEGITDNGKILSFRKTLF